MPAISGIVPFSLICARYEVTVGAQRLEPEYLLENIRSHRHPTFTAFWKKILLRSIHDPDASIANPVHTRIHNLNVA